MYLLLNHDSINNNNNNNRKILNELEGLFISSSQLSEVSKDLDPEVAARLAGSGSIITGGASMGIGSASHGSARGSEGSSNNDQTSSSSSYQSKWSHANCENIPQQIRNGDKTFKAKSIAWYTAGFLSSHSVLVVLFQNDYNPNPKYPQRDIIVTADLIADKNNNQFFTKTKCRQFEMEYNKGIGNLNEYIKLNGNMKDIKGMDNYENWNGLNYFSNTHYGPINIENDKEINKISLQEFLWSVNVFNGHKYRVGSFNCNFMAYQIWTVLFQQTGFFGVTQPSYYKGMFAEKIAPSIGYSGNSMMESGQVLVASGSSVEAAAIEVDLMQNDPMLYLMLDNGNGVFLPNEFPNFDNFGNNEWDQKIKDYADNQFLNEDKQTLRGQLLGLIPIQQKRQKREKPSRRIPKKLNSKQFVATSSNHDQASNQQETKINVDQNPYKTNHQDITSIDPEFALRNLDNISNKNRQKATRIPEKVNSKQSVAIPLNQQETKVNGDQNQYVTNHEDATSIDPVFAMRNLDEILKKIENGTDVDNVVKPSKKPSISNRQETKINVDQNQYVTNHKDPTSIDPEFAMRNLDKILNKIENGTDGESVLSPLSSSEEI